MSVADEFTYRLGDRAFLIRHERVSGFSTFTSPDLPGLHITAPDAAKARARLAGEISRLARPTKSRR